jgi:hypothetical protein
VLIQVRVWLALVRALTSQLSPKALDNGVEKIVAKWERPGDAQKMTPWPADFTRNINPFPCHSHNDYWRKVPLFSALAAGCVSVEGDIWFQDGSDELRVGHSASSLSAERTLRSLYIDPITHILEEQNKALPEGEVAGVFETAPNQTLVVLLDFKTNGSQTWPLVQTHLQVLREKRWLTHWNTTTKSRTVRPITVVATGNAPFDLVSQLDTQDIFMDAPLDRLDAGYTAENSYYASISMGAVVGKIHHSLNAHQLELVDKQVKSAELRGLVSRYWDTPSWPISTRNRVWETLVDHGVGVLNVDSLETATRWDWRWCRVAGLNLCG